MNCIVQEASRNILENANIKVMQSASGPHPEPVNSLPKLVCVIPYMSIYLKLSLYTKFETKYLYAFLVSPTPAACRALYLSTTPLLVVTASL